MSELVQVSNVNGIAVVGINNPPVNALSDEVREAIREAFEQLANDASVKAVVLIGCGNTFIAGADINKFVEITSGRAQRVPALLNMLRKLEDSAKPIVCAIHGNAFGGGLETAMACHYRVAAPNSKIGQLEVKLGLIPGAGGTQRLPRLAGIAKAVEMCTEGNPIKVEDAIKFGIADKLIEGDLRAGAISFAEQVAEKPAPKTRERSEKLAGTPEQKAAIFVTAREAARKKQRGLMAPQAAIDAIEAAAKLPFEEGCEVEQRLFKECLFSDQSKALIHIFFAEREVPRVPDVPKETPVMPVNKVAVVGAGTMGGGIAMAFANAGIPVVIKDAEQALLDRGLGIIRKNYDNSVKRGRFTPEYVAQRMDLIRPTLSYNDFADVDLVIEAVFESMAVKKEVFGELDKVCKRGAILASNTSTLSIDEIASATARPEAVVGTHFFSPANVMRLLEIVRGMVTSKEVIATCMNISKRLGKIGVLVGNCTGFVGNRMYYTYRREAQFLVEEGSSPSEVDAALSNFGMAMGVCSVADMSGLDISWRARKETLHLRKPGIRYPIAEDRLCEIGRFGQKTGAGWYKYDAERRQSPDPEIVEQLHQRAAAAGIAQRKIGPEEIVERCQYALINEGTRILEEGFALRPGDIDIVYVNGYGFPAYRGGPMWYAETVGLKKVYDRICEFRNQIGEMWEPAALLKHLVEQGKSFAEFGKGQWVTA
jgi:3-hydroxyacyl-CoA dehydrogenase